MSSFIPHCQISDVDLEERQERLGFLYDIIFGDNEDIEDIEDIEAYDIDEGLNYATTRR